MRHAGVRAPQLGGGMLKSTCSMWRDWLRRIRRWENAFMFVGFLAEAAFSLDFAELVDFSGTGGRVVGSACRGWRGRDGRRRCRSRLPL